MEAQKTETVNQEKQETVTKQKSPLRINQGRRLVEYNRHKKEELKHLNDHITKQDDMIEHKPKPDFNNNYIYVCGISVFGLAVCGYLLYTKFKKPEQNLIDVPPPANVSYESTKTKPHIDIFEMH